MNKRIFYYDALRAISIIGIVFCHASVVFVLSGVDNPDFYIAAFFDCFREFSIPIFVMLSGALLIGKKDSFTDFFKKRLSRIFIPFIFWVVIYVIYAYFYQASIFSVSYAIDIFFGTSSTLGVAFWFIWMIVIAYIGIFIINKLNLSSKSMNALTLISLAYILICQLGLFDPYSDKIIYFVSFMTYIIIGHFITSNDFLEKRFSPKILAVVTLVLSVASYLLYIFGFVVPTSISNGQFVYLSYFNIPILFISVNVFLLFKFLSKCHYLDNMDENHIGKALLTISKYSFGIYLAHYMILNSLRNNLIKLVDYTHQSYLIWIPVFVILAICISLIILTILNKIPYLNKVSGAN